MPQELISKPIHRLLTLVLVAIFPVSVGGSPVYHPKPFDIEYKVSINGIPIGLKAEAKLRKRENRYLFELHSQNWVLDYFEKSAFIWNEQNPCSIQTENYQFRFEGFGKTEAFEVNIDHESLTAHSQTKKGPVHYPVNENVSDALAYLFKLQCDLSHGVLNPSYEIAYDDEVDQYIFRFSHEEKIRTPFGKLNTLVLKRIYTNDDIETTYWIAPSMNHLMVRMKHKQGKLVTATLKLKTLSYDIHESELEEDEAEEIDLNEIEE